MSRSSLLLSAFTSTSPASHEVLLHPAFSMRTASPLVCIHIVTATVRCTCLELDQRTMNKSKLQMQHSMPWRGCPHPAQMKKGRPNVGLRISPAATSAAVPVDFPPQQRRTPRHPRNTPPRHGSTPLLHNHPAATLSIDDLSAHSCPLTFFLHLSDPLRHSR